MDNQQEIIWLADDIDRFLETAVSEGKPWIGDGLRLAAATGFRLADLVTLTFDHVGEHAINTLALKKSRDKRRRAIIPITVQLGELLEELRGRHRADGVNHVDEDGAEKSKHRHDVRGTFCTMLLTECELTDEQTAEIMVWSPERLRGIRKVYVDESRACMALARRVSAKQKAKQDAK